MGIIFKDFTFLNIPTYISVVILSFFSVAECLSLPHEPHALPEVNRLALGGTVSPRETPSPSCHNTFAPANVDLGTRATTVLYHPFAFTVQPKL